MARKSTSRKSAARPARRPARPARRAARPTRPSAPRARRNPASAVYDVTLFPHDEKHCFVCAVRDVPGVYRATRIASAPDVYRVVIGGRWNVDDTRARLLAVEDVRHVVRSPLGKVRS